MSVWLQLVNEIKRRSPDQLITPAQRIARDQVLNFMRFPQWINLYGKPGSGKTFIAWALARAGGAGYLSFPDQLKNITLTQEALLIDNAPHEEFDVRRILSSCDLLGASSVVLITRMPITMPMKRVEVPLPSSEDLALIFKSLGLLNYPCRQSTLPPSPNLWDVLQACV